MKSVDPAKAVIWTCLLVAAAGVACHYWLQDRIEQASRDVTLSLNALKDVAEAKAEIDALEAELAGDEYRKSQSSNQGVLTYFEKMAGNAGLPRPSASAARDDTPRRGKEMGFKDTSYELTWEKSGRQRPRFDRERIAKFAWWLENQSKLLNVTSIQLSTEPREFDDLWEFRLWVTERRPTTAAEG